MPASEADLLGLLEGLGVDHTLYRHPPLHTVEESRALRGEMPGGHCKSLFVKDKKHRFGLFVVDEDRRVDLKSAGPSLGFGRLSFGSPARMMERLGVIPGAVTPFALINCPASEDFKIVLDQRMMDEATQQGALLHYHPLHNEATIGISPGDLLRFIHHLGHQPEFYTF